MILPNFVTTLEYVGIGSGFEWSGGNMSANSVATSFPARRNDNNNEDDCILYQTGSAAAPTVYFKYTKIDPAQGSYPFIVLRAYGRDTTIAPDLAATTGVYKYKTAAQLGLTAIGHEAYFIVETASDWAAGSKTFTIEDGSKTVTLAAYVAPSSLSGTGPVVFK